mmetsp:Transcript_54394/g.100489  ORF Transcript_54394/g.100489 Transcript_54394/m.100489 type:complete len:203 (+) Transcript_54394:34-642(+)
MTLARQLHLSHASSLVSDQPVTFQSVKDKFDDLAEDLDSLDHGLMSQSKSLLDVLARLRAAYPARNKGTAVGLEDASGSALGVQEKLETFGDRIDEAMRKAMKFNQLVLEVEQQPGNKLPKEMGEDAGTVVNLLRKASELADGQLRQESEDLVEATKGATLKLGAAPCEVALLCTSRWTTNCSAANFRSLQALHRTRNASFL